MFVNTVLDYSLGARLFTLIFFNLINLTGNLEITLVYYLKCMIFRGEEGDLKSFFPCVRPWMKVKKNRCLIRPIPVLKDSRLSVDLN